MYLDSHHVVFTTLALGEEYRNKVATQIQSILKFTQHDAYIITDSPEFFGNYYGPRIHYIKFDENFTDLPIISPQGMFNYNLKMTAIKWTIENVRAPITVWMDADSFLFGWIDRFDKHFPSDAHGVWGRFRQPLNTVTDPLVLKKIETLEIDTTDINVRMPIENILIFKNGSTVKPFLEEWDRLAHLTIEKGARGDFESIEMSIAIHRTGIPYYHCDGNNSAWVDSFRTLHHGKIHIPFVI